jgi:hypothetical protein
MAGLKVARSTPTALHVASGGSRDAAVLPVPRPVAASAGGVDVGLMAYFALWYLGNYYYNITNKLALKVRPFSHGAHHYCTRGPLYSLPSCVSLMLPTAS